MLTHNDGHPGVLGRARLFAGIAPSRAVQLVALGALYAGTAYIGDETADLEAVSLRVTLSRALVLEGGKLLSPVGAFAPRRLSPVNPLIGEPDAYPTSYPWGGEAWGTISVLDYRFAVVNLPPTHEGYVPEATGRARVVIGAGISPATGIRLGGTFTRGSYLGEDVQPQIPGGRAWGSFPQTVVGIDGRFSRGYFDLHGEWAHSTFEVPTVGTVSGPAYYLELKYTWSPRFFTAARFQRNDYPFILPMPNHPWLGFPVNFYAGEFGVGLRLGKGILAKVSYQKDDWTNHGQLSGRAIAAQFSYQFDVTEWLTGRR
jgi:hypothetical protein